VNKTALMPGLMQRSACAERILNSAVRLRLVHAVDGQPSVTIGDGFRMFRRTTGRFGATAPCQRV
jgi:hypothetical protein